MKITDLSTDQLREVFDEGILRQRPETFMYSGLAANAEIIRSAYKGVLDGSTQSWRAIFQTALDAIRRGQLVLNPNYVAAFQDGFSGDAAQKSGIVANEQIIIGSLVDRKLACTAENIKILIGEWWDDLADNPQYTSQEAVRKQRAFHIAEMTQNGTAGFSVQVGPKRFAFDKNGKTYDYQAGMAQGGSLSLKGAWSPGQGGFSSMSDEQVAELYTQWKTANDLKAMSKEDLRKLVRENGATDIFGKTQQLPRVTAQDEGALINEITGAEITTQAELLAYLRNPNDDKHIGGRGRRLVVNKNTGQSIPAKLQRFQALIRGELG